MKTLRKLEIKPERVMKDEELMTLRGGYGSYKCYKEGYIPGCYNFLAYINTASCTMAMTICYEVYTGYCVEGWDCG
jgi:hypothetical protein